MSNKVSTVKVLLKVAGIGALAGASKAVIDALPSVLPPNETNLITVIIAAIVGYLLPQPHKSR